MTRKIIRSQIRVLRTYTRVHQKSIPLACLAIVLTVIRSIIIWISTKFCDIRPFWNVFKVKYNQRLFSIAQRPIFVLCQSINCKLYIAALAYGIIPSSKRIPTISGTKNSSCSDYVKQIRTQMCQSIKIQISVEHSAYEPYLNTLSLTKSIYYRGY